MHIYPHRIDNGRHQTFEEKCYSSPSHWDPKDPYPSGQSLSHFTGRGKKSPHKGGTCPRSHGEWHFFSSCLLNPSTSGAGCGIWQCLGDPAQVTEHCWASASRLQSGWDHCPNLLGFVRVEWDKACRALSMVSGADLLSVSLNPCNSLGRHGGFTFACLFWKDWHGGCNDLPMGTQTGEWIPESKHLHSTWLR